MSSELMIRSPGKLETLLTRYLVFLTYHVFHGSAGKMNQMDPFLKSSKYAMPKTIFVFHRFQRRGILLY